MQELTTFIPDSSTLSSDLAALAPELDAFVSSFLVTRIHGDAKGWNLFLGREGIAEDKILMIDFQWTGKGHPLQVSVTELVRYRSLFLFRKNSDEVTELHENLFKAADACPAHMCVNR